MYAAFKHSDKLLAFHDWGCIRNNNPYPSNTGSLSQYRIDCVPCFLVIFSVALRVEHVAVYQQQQNRFGSHKRDCFTTLISSLCDEKIWIFGLNSRIARPREQVSQVGA